MPCSSVIASRKILFSQSANSKSKSIKPASIKITPIALLLTLSFGSASYVHADSMGSLITQKSVQPELSVPAARVSTHSTIKRVSINPPTVNYNNRVSASPVINTYRYQQPSINTPAISALTVRTLNTNSPIKPSINSAYRYPEVNRQPPMVLPAFLSGNYDNIDSQYLPLLGRAETQSSRAAQGVISTARTMALNERTIIQGGCWDYLNTVFNRAGVTRDTIHQGVYAQGPYAHSSEIEIGDWLYYINHGYNGVEHSGLFVGWVDEAAKQALILSYAGESRREPARYRVYDLSNVYQIMRPIV